RDIPPQQVSKPFSRLWLAAALREQGKQRTGLAGNQFQLPAVRRCDVQLSEQVNAQHGLHGTPLVSSPETRIRVGAAFDVVLTLVVCSAMPVALTVVWRFR